MKRSYQTNLVFCKNRLAPIKSISLPRLILLALLIGVRASLYVERKLHLTLSRRVLWTDSKCVLYWLKTLKTLSIFVTNRLREIKQAKGIEFRYLPSEDNIADLATKGCTLQELVKNQRQWKGPHWLSSAEEFRPKEMTYEGFKSEEEWKQEHQIGASNIDEKHL